MPRLKRDTIWPTEKEDAAINAGIAHDPDSPELTDEDFSQMKPFSSLPRALQTKLRGPQKAPLKRPTTIRFDADVLDALKATGRGWQTRVNEAMREWVKAQEGA